MDRDVLIVGGGRVGRHVAGQLPPQRNAVTIVERDPETCERLRADGAAVIEGDGTEPAVFGAADPGTVDVVAALTNDTETNLAVCELATERASAATTILRIARDGEQDYGYRSAVDHVIYPAETAATVTAGRIERVPVG
jgi:trk system potassium uptake protein TrkA